MSLKDLVGKAILQNTQQELALGWLRYEALRRLSPRMFAEFHRRNLAGEIFDDIVTEELLQWKNERCK